MTKELEGSRQMMVKKQSEIDQLQNEVCFVLMGRWSHADGHEPSSCFSVFCLVAYSFQKYQKFYNSEWKVKRDSEWKILTIRKKQNIVLSLI